MEKTAHVMIFVMGLLLIGGIALAIVKGVQKGEEA